MTTVPFPTLVNTLERVFKRIGLSVDDATLCARIHAESTWDGVASHGVGRITRFVDYVQRGWVDSQATLQRVHTLGALEVYDGNFGIGVRNAMEATERAMALADEHGLGLVALRNTTHWMRGGSYGWHAVERGYAALMWTNTEPCMPAWGSSEQSIGNNPLVMAVPSDKGPLVLDMAMSQFSYGKLKTLERQEESLPIDGGFDSKGQLSRDPAAIQATRRILPTGYWKGSGLAILLDALAALLSQGRPSHEIDNLQRGSGTGCCQVFMVFNPQHLGGSDLCQTLVDGITAHLSSATPDETERQVRWPGKSTHDRRQLNKDNNDATVEIDDGTWNAIIALAE
ncbi:3-dehydro-L-gulonate 2-dehydrogenase [Aidingimonas halophila]|uniref:3-dehydro-L-gulonate 2-dehydrogenase n=1 Tax=Aidingimonas halophila TaxID=574349 RepID=A0A1H3G7B3_9GAMM|nr:3-dehydro-L-gulonate 2-dehydrogenase [Aidingimonas halophila]GHC32665.1 2,3-diketo-L-gulonate reductase [Aidingimonas halophila]SDX98940.1 3-dehydro-L-gulonate 2-dehydrogenase [Aidingimonas halophila]